ncbi:hypothetical protein SAMN05421823_101653 [Catalinimonas alkaloidigena]|uniref:Uncharacterized protein n=1 Tax=Catalinimonas alkaloidigena TaxID=1075417 RepID=A0A1G8YGI5_9BACT|nr:hypothetical protein [Catalinimonas alkaloidigena]SDK01335.1 hypothetical protein SAMN05421823_101653 [Catalinimonas alkaloidigena]
MNRLYYFLKEWTLERRKTELFDKMQKEKGRLMGVELISETGLVLGQSDIDIQRAALFRLVLAAPTRSEPQA